MSHLQEWCYGSTKQYSQIFTEQVGVYISPSFTKLLIPSDSGDI